MAATTKDLPLPAYDSRNSKRHATLAHHNAAQTAQPHTEIPAQWWFGGVASVIAALCTHPLDTLKIRLQTSTQRHRVSIFGTVSDMVRNEGVGGLYAGLSASILRQLTYSTTRFAIYDSIKARMLVETNGAPLPFTWSLTAAMIGGAAGGVVGTPADLCNVRMQNDAKLPLEHRRSYKHAFDGLWKIGTLEGPSALFIGVGPNVQRAVFMTAGQIGSYDLIKQAMLRSKRFKDDTTTHFVSSLGAGLVATTVCSPMDVLKTRIMSANQGSGAYKSTTDAFLTILRSEGPMAFLKGWIPSYTRLGPHTIITFMAYEQVKSMYVSYKGRSD